MFGIALDFTSKFCCDRHPNAPPFNLHDFLPGPIYIQPPLDLKRKKKRTEYRAISERNDLDAKLLSWLEEAHATDHWRVVRPIYHILSHAQRKKVVWAPPKSIKSPGDITTLLGESPDWAEEWSFKIFEVIQTYNKDIALKKASSKPRAAARQRIN